MSHIVLRRPRLRRTLSVVLLVCIDALAVALAFGATRMLAGSGSWLGVTAPELLEGLIVLAACWAVAACAGLYGLRWRRNDPRRVIAAAGVVLAFAAIIPLFELKPALESGMLVFWILVTALAVAFRLAYDIGVRNAIDPEHDGEGVVVIGEGREAMSLVQSLNRQAGASRYCLLEAIPKEAVGRLDESVRRRAPTTVIMAASLENELAVESVLSVSRRQGLTFLVVSEGLGSDPICLLPGAGGPLFAVSVSHMRRWRYLAKRALDVVLSSLAIAIMAPVFLAVIVLIRLDSPGPAFYVSWRVGACLKVFPCLKFRTMCRDADVRQAEFEASNEAEGCLFKLADDPRVTRVGHVLRRTSLDELPQLFNVLAGHMSLVGPRPLPLRDVSLMDDRQKRRHVVLPGITGPWQVSGRSDLGTEAMIRLDLRYVESWSLRADAAILARTVLAVATSKGAY